MTQIYSQLEVPDTGNALGVDVPEELSSSLSNDLLSHERNKTPEYEADFMLLCAESVPELKEKCNCLNYVRYDGMLWIALPENVEFEEEMKKEDCRRLMEDLNITQVSAVNLGKGWRAYRFRPVERVHTVSAI